MGLQYTTDEDCQATRWLNGNLIESQNHRMVWVGRGLKHHLVPNPLPWTGTPSLAQVAQAPSNLTLNNSREGKPTASLSNLLPHIK